MLAAALLCKTHATVTTVTFQLIIITNVALGPYSGLLRMSSIFFDFDWKGFAIVDVISYCEALC